MTRIQYIITTFIVITASGLQLWKFSDPYVLHYETGFQEQIARRHLDPGISQTYGISTINNFSHEPTFHPTHPPLLQLVLAGLFYLLGDQESTARLIPLFSYWFCLLGLWRITEKHLSVSSRIGILAAFAFAPLSFFMGRVVNFEPPVVACTVWTVKWLQDIHKDNENRTLLLLLMVVAGTLTDWVYLLFFTCLWILYFLATPSKPNIRKMLTKLWLLSMGLLIAYIGIMYCIGAFENVLHHIKVQSGTYQSAAWKLPLFMQWSWWQSIGLRLFWNGTPVLFLGLFAWLGWALWQWRWRNGFVFLCMVQFVFAVAYILIFSRASNQHMWCLFYFMPGFVLIFGQFLEWIPSRFRIILVLILLACAFPIARDLRTQTPNQTETQFGKIIASGVERTFDKNPSRFDSPVLYTNRVDPLAYYANLDTAYFYMSIGAAMPDNFLVRFRPEFVAVSGIGSKTALIMKEEDQEQLYERLNKSYTLTHEEHGTQLWESNWSPLVSLMGLISLPDGSKAKTQLIDDTHEVHIGTHVMPGESAMSINVETIWISGRRWLKGWVIVPPGYSTKPIEVTLQSERGVPLGKFSVQPNGSNIRWQPFEVYMGYRPHQIIASWQGSKIIFGDIRLVSETNYTHDLTRLLAGEIHRKTRPNDYRETLVIQQNEMVYHPISQRPGVVTGSLQVPHIRNGYDKKLSVTYGIHPDYDAQQSPITFRLLMRDMALGKPYVLFEDKVSTDKRGEMITQEIDLRDHSRHVLTFTFEVECGGEINADVDSALWYEARIIDIKQ